VSRSPSGRESKGRRSGATSCGVHVDPKATPDIGAGGSGLSSTTSPAVDDISQISTATSPGKARYVLPGHGAAFVGTSAPETQSCTAAMFHFDADRRRGGARVRTRTGRLERCSAPSDDHLPGSPRTHSGAKGAPSHAGGVACPGSLACHPRTAHLRISKRLADDERKRLRASLDRVKPAEPRRDRATAAEGVTRGIESGRERLSTSVADRRAGQAIPGPTRCNRERGAPWRCASSRGVNKDTAVVVIDDRSPVQSPCATHVRSIKPELADRVEPLRP